MPAKRKAKRKAAKTKPASQKAAKSDHSRKAPAKKAARRSSNKGVASSIRAIESAEDSCTARQTRFCYEYIATPDLNGTKAAIAAGCPADSAATQASKWLRNPKVKKLLTELKRERAERVLMTADDVLRELKLICQSNIADLIVESHGVYRLANVKDVKELPRAISAGVLEMKTTTRYDSFGNEIVETTMKLHPKVAALALAGKHVDVRAFMDNNPGEVAPVTLVIESGLGTPPGGEASP